MKFIYCRTCHDVFKLALKERRCECGRTSGWYLKDGHSAEVHGKEAEVIGIDDKTLVMALKSAEIEHPTHGLGPDVRAWVFPRNYYRIRRRDLDRKEPKV